MLTLDTTNLHKVKSEHGLSKRDLLLAEKNLVVHLENFAKRGQHFHEIVDDMEVIKEIEKFVKETKGKFTDVVVLGIGGSALGTICLQKALQPLYGEELKKRSWPRVRVLDNIDPVLIKELENILSLKKTLFIAVSKSGGTPETLAMFMYFKNKLQKAGLKPKNHLVAIADKGPRFLRDICEKEQIQVFNHGPVGGRFAVLSSVGLLPAALSGIKIRQLLAGARAMRDLFVSKDYKKNLPFQVAVIQYLLEEKGKVMNVLMPYSQRLMLFPDWFRQLLAESIGKEIDNSGKIVNTGITPISALGTTDQHSQSQLYTEGPNDKLIIFLEVADFGKKLAIPLLYPNQEEVSFFKGVDFATLFSAEKQATADAYTKYNKPNITIKINKVNEEALGELFFLFEGATAFLGEMYNINAFDQPGVELSKVLTRKYLKK